MSLDQFLLIGIAIGLAVVGATLFLARRDQARRNLRAPVRPQPAPAATTARIEPPPGHEGPLRKLAELRSEEDQRDAAVREELRTGWRPLSADSLKPRRPATEDAAPTRDEPKAAEPAKRSRPKQPAPPVVTQVSDIDLDHDTKMDPDSAAKLKLSVGQAFTPSAPVSRRDLFAGRESQLETLVDVVFETGQHAIVYGERGVGKTSLATILGVVFSDQPGRVPIRINCDASDDFDSVWRKVIDELDATVEASDTEMPKARAAIDRALTKSPLRPNDVTRLLKQLSPDLVAVVIIDEFDTMTDEATPRLFADTIKMLSDQLVPSTLVVVGIADTLDELLSEHSSVSRALVHVHMPRMSQDELKEIVTRGLDLLTMGIDDEALDLIARLSKGFPHFTHLLAQAAARSAIDSHRPLVILDDVQVATTKVADRIETWIQDTYNKATSSAHNSIYAQVLVAGALAHSDERGYFAAADVKRPMTTVMRRKYDIPSFIRQLNALAEDERGPVLLRIGTDRRHRYRFVEPQMEPYVIMRSLGDGLIDVAVLRELTTSDGAA